MLYLKYLMNPWHHEVVLLVFFTSKSFFSFSQKFWFFFLSCREKNSDLFREENGKPSLKYLSQNHLVSPFCNIVFVAAFILLYLVCTQISHRSSSFMIFFHTFSANFARTFWHSLYFIWLFLTITSFIYIAYYIYIILLIYILLVFIYIHIDR